MFGFQRLLAQGLSLCSGGMALEATDLLKTNHIVETCTNKRVPGIRDCSGMNGKTKG
jgi:hypothetical protein